MNNTSSLSFSSSSSCCCPSETGCLHGKQDKLASGSFYNDVFGPVPSQSEVESAIAALRSFMRRIASPGLLQVLDGYQRFEDAFYLLMRDPVTERLVVSLSTDNALWNAITSNDMLQRLQGSYVDTAEIGRIQNCDQETHVFTFILNWIMNMTKAKVTELIENFQSLMNEIFQSLERKKPAEESIEVDDRIKSSLLLSVVILLIVVVARFHKD